jgi:nucleotide-binding universal stress UspA family protein
VVHRAQGILDDGLAILNRAGLTARGRLAPGDGATAILHDASVNRADLIVAGSRGLGAVRGWLLGSVSRQLVHKSGSSVLIVREDRPERPKPSGIADNRPARTG